MKATNSLIRNAEVKEKGKINLEIYWDFEGGQVTSQHFFLLKLLVIKF